MIRRVWKRDLEEECVLKIRDALSHSEIVVDPTRIFHPNYIHHVHELVRSRTDLVPIHVMAVAKVRLLESLDSICERFRRIFSLHFTDRVDMLISGQPIVEFSLDRECVEMVKLNKSTLIMAVSTEIELERLDLCIRVGTLASGLDYPKIVKLLSIAYPEPPQVWLTIVIMVRLFGTVPTRVEYRLVDVCDEELARAVIDMLKRADGRIVLRGLELLREGQDTVYKFGNARLDLDPTSGSKGDIVFRPKLYIDDRLVRRFKFIVVRGLNGRVTVKERYIVVD